MAVTFGPILLAALWLGGLPWRAWVGLMLAALVVVGCAWLWLLKPYQQERILTFVDPERAPYSSGYQQRQSKIAVGSGEVTGKGLQSGTQSQLRFLPAQYTDFIFAVWAEETGFVGSTLLLAAYALLVCASSSSRWPPAIVSAPCSRAAPVSCCRPRFWSTWAW